MGKRKDRWPDPIERSSGYVILRLLWIAWLWWSGLRFSFQRAL